MALSQKVKEALEESKSNLRNALWYASKNEKAIVNKKISDILLSIEMVEKGEELSDKMEELINDMKNNDQNGGNFLY